MRDRLTKATVSGGGHLLKRARCSARLAALSSPGGRRRRAIAMILVSNGGVSL
jgi:hypothetical protein